MFKKMFEIPSAFFFLTPEEKALVNKLFPATADVPDNDGIGGSGVELPEGVLSIGIESFSFCKNLKAMTLPSSLKKIGKNAFELSENVNFIFPKDREKEFHKMIKDGQYGLPF